MRLFSFLCAAVCAGLACIFAALGLWAVVINATLFALLWMADGIAHAIRGHD